jgi:hypothetical protein
LKNDKVDVFGIVIPIDISFIHNPEIDSSRLSIKLGGVLFHELKHAEQALDKPLNIKSANKLTIEGKLDYSKYIEDKSEKEAYQHQYSKLNERRPNDNKIKYDRLVDEYYRKLNSKYQNGEIDVNEFNILLDKFKKSKESLLE